MADIFKSKYTGEQIENLLEKADGITVQSGADEQEFESITIEGKTYHLPQQQEPQVVQANPADEATEELTKLKVGNTTYEIPESGSSVVANPSSQGRAELERLEVDGVTYDIPQQTEVVANPVGVEGDVDLHNLKIGNTIYRIIEPQTVSANTLGTPEEVLENILIGSKIYSIPRPTDVEANPTGDGTVILSKLKIGSTIYTILSGGAPIEISTEAAMNAVLEGAQIGSIFKYVGATTDTYENGALYVVEEEAVQTHSLTITNSGGEWLSCIVDKTELSDGELATVINSGETHTFENVSSFVQCSSPYGLTTTRTETNNCRVEYDAGQAVALVYPTGDNATVKLYPRT